MANQAAVTAWRRAYQDPEGEQSQQAFASQAAAYRLLWHYYVNSVFDDFSTFAAYKGRYRLYRQIRSIYNPTRRLVDFYAGQVYPGVLTEDGSQIEDGIPLAIPLARDTPVELSRAIGQFWQWSNWQANKAVMVRFGAALGDVLVEIVDDVERGKVVSNVIWPGFVSDLRLDPQGNVKAYTLDYQATDDDGATYRYTKTVNQETITTTRNGAETARSDNPYGFTPAVWGRHISVGGDHGVPAVHGSVNKIDELNSLASHVHDQVHKKIGAPMVLWTSGQVGNLFDAGKRQPTDRLLQTAEDRESLLMLKGPEGGRVESLTGDLDLSQVLPYLQQLLHEIEADHPELTLYRELRAMSQVTGPAASRLMGDVASVVWEAAANYDQQSIKLFQMAVAVGGWRAQRGDWGGTLTRQQQKFLPFDLTSYARGELDLAILPRPLVPLTKLERLSEQRQQLALDRDRMAGQNPAGIEQRILAAASAGA